MAECHPVGFQWVMEAKARGAKIIHVDPRFTRTSAVSDLHVPLRAGTDIAFLGGLIRYAIENDAYFRDYVVAYTNAPFIVGEEFVDTEDLDGVFSGLDPEQGSYDTGTWQYQGAEVASAAGKRDQQYADRTGGGGKGGAQRGSDSGRGESHGSGGASGTGGAEPDRDDTLEHPRCVFQLLKRHFSRYTPAAVAQVCGVPEELFLQVAEEITRNSGRERTTAFAYSVGWTHHTVGVQYIRTAAILQALLGNIGRPGGGILALRGHARSRARPTSRRCSTSSPATSRCRTRTSTRRSRTSSRPTPAPRATGATCSPTPSACSRPGGGRRRPPRTSSASTTCRG